MQEKFVRSSHIYRVNSVIDLEGGTLSIPWNSILDFSGGGKITNGSLVFNDTLIVPSGCMLERYITADITGRYGEGQVLYDSTLKKQKLWNGSAWVNLDGSELEGTTEEAEV